jgi:hypothetical protein
LACTTPIGVGWAVGAIGPVTAYPGADAAPTTAYPGGLPAVAAIAGPEGRAGIEDIAAAAPGAAAAAIVASSQRGHGSLCITTPLGVAGGGGTWMPCASSSAR